MTGKRNQDCLIYVALGKFLLVIVSFLLVYHPYFTIMVLDMSNQQLLIHTGHAEIATCFHRLFGRDPCRFYKTDDVIHF